MRRGPHLVQSDLRGHDHIILQFFVSGPDNERTGEYALPGGRSCLVRGLFFLRVTDRAELIPPAPALRGIGRAFALEPSRQLPDHHLGIPGDRNLREYVLVQFRVIYVYVDYLRFRRKSPRRKQPEIY